jgi:hypothetical protein
LKLQRRWDYKIQILHVNSTIKSIWKEGKIHTLCFCVIILGNHSGAALYKYI